MEKTIEYTKTLMNPIYKDSGNYQDVIHKKNQRPEMLVMILQKITGFI